MKNGPLCAKDRHGIWCALVGEPSETASSVETRCGGFIVLPHGMERREPTCQFCRDALDKERG